MTVFRGPGEGSSRGEVQSGHWGLGLSSEGRVWRSVPSRGNQKGQGTLLGSEPLLQGTQGTQKDSSLDNA